MWRDGKIVPLSPRSTQCVQDDLYITAAMVEKGERVVASQSLFHIASLNELLIDEAGRDNIIVEKSKEKK